MTTNLVLMDVIATDVIAGDVIARDVVARDGHVAAPATLVAGQPLAEFRSEGLGLVTGSDATGSNGTGSNGTGSRARAERRTPEVLRDAEPTGGIARAGLAVDPTPTSGPALSYRPSMSILQPRDHLLLG